MARINYIIIAILVNATLIPTGIAKSIPKSKPAAKPQPKAQLDTVSISGDQGTGHSMGYVGGSVGDTFGTNLNGVNQKSGLVCENINCHMESAMPPEVHQSCCGPPPIEINLRPPSPGNTCMDQCSRQCASVPGPLCLSQCHYACARYTQ